MADDKEVSQPILAFKDSLDEFIKQKDENSKETIEHQAQSLYYADESLRTQKEDFNLRKQDSKNSEKLLASQAQSLYYADESLRTQKADFEAGKGNKSLKKAKTQTDKIQQDRLVKGLKGIGSGIKGLLKKASDFSGATPSVIKALLTGGAFFLLAKFLQSDFAQNIVFKIYMRLKKLAKDIMEFDFSFMGLYNIIKDNFLTIVGILAVFKPKLLFNIIKGSLFGLAGLIDKVGKDADDTVKKSRMGRVLGKLKGSFAGLKGSISGFGQSLKKFGRGFKLQMRLLQRGSLDKGLKKMVASVRRGSLKALTGFGEGINGAFRMMGTGIGKAAKFLKAGFMPALAAIHAGITNFVVAMFRTIVGSFKFLVGVLMANPIALAIAVIVGVFIYIGKKLGIFKKLGKFLSGLFDKIVNGFKSLYNSFANSYLGKKLGITPLADDVSGEPPEPDKDPTFETDSDKAEFESETPEQKKQAAFDIKANALDKMVSMMGVNKGQNQQININNSKNNNSKSVTTANVAIDDNSPVIQSLKGQATA